MSVCLECAAKVLWVKTVNDVAMPLDLEPTLAGNIRLVGNVGHKVPPGQLPVQGDAYTCHLETCTKKRALAPVANRKARCKSCGLVMHPLITPNQTRHPCC